MQPVCTDTETRTKMLFLCSVMQSSSFQLCTQKASFLTFFLHALCEWRVFTFLMLFLSISSLQLSISESSLHLLDRLAVKSPWKLFGSHGSGAAQVWLCVYFLSDILLLFLLLGPTEKFVSYVCFDDSCLFNRTIYLSDGSITHFS